jgi:hypothetical protein
MTAYTSYFVKRGNGLDYKFEGGGYYSFQETFEEFVEIGFSESFLFEEEELCLVSFSFYKPQEIIGG